MPLVSKITAKNSSPEKDRAPKGPKKGTSSRALLILFLEILESEPHSEEEDEGEEEEDYWDEEEEEPELPPPKKPARLEKKNSPSPGKKKKKGRLIMNVAYLSYDVVKEVAEQNYGYKLVEDEEIDFDLIWYDLWVGPSVLVRMHSH